MPNEEFPQPKSKELTQEQLERVIEIKIDPNSSLGDILDFAKTGEIIRFIIDENFNLILSTEQHEMLCQKLMINRDECIIPDGDFYIETKFNMIYFIYLFDSCYNKKKKTFCDAAQIKIKKFLESKNIDLNGFKISQVGTSEGRRQWKNQ